MTEVSLTLSAIKDRKPGPIFEPASIPCGAITHVKILEKETNEGNTGVAILIQLPDGRKVMAKTTAKIIDMIGGAVRGACIMWGDTSNWKEWLQALQVEAVDFADAYCGAGKENLTAAYRKWKKTQGIDLDAEKIPGT